MTEQKRLYKSRLFGQVTYVNLSSNRGTEAEAEKAEVEVLEPIIVEVIKPVDKEDETTHVKEETENTHITCEACEDIKNDI